MSDKIYEVPAEWTKRAFIDERQVPRECTSARSTIPNGFWAEQAKRIHWYQAVHQGQEHLLRPAATSRSNGSRTAPPTPPTTASTAISPSAATRPPSSGKATTRRTPRRSPISELHDEVCRFANILRNRNVEKGDRVTIYMPMIPEAAYAMLACARIGAIHSVVFGGFSPDSLAGRIEDCKSNVVITADEGLRGGRKVPLKANTDAAIAKVGGVDHVIVVQAHRRARSTWSRCATSGTTRPPTMVTAECPCERDERRRPAVHPLHVGLDRQAEGRAAHHRRLSGLRRDDAPIRVRLSRRRHLLVHRRRRLGHRPQLHRLRAARERRHHADVRRRAELSDRCRASGR